MQMRKTKCAVSGVPVLRKHGTEEYNDVPEPIISREIWNLIQEMFIRNKYAAGKIGNSHLHVWATAV